MLFPVVGVWSRRRRRLLLLLLLEPVVVVVVVVVILERNLNPPKAAMAATLASEVASRKTITQADQVSECRVRHASSSKGNTSTGIDWIRLDSIGAVTKESSYRSTTG